MNFQNSTSLETDVSEEARRELRKQAGAWLQDLRARAGLSQSELASRLGLKYYSFISQVELGKARLPSYLLLDWASALEIDPAELAESLLSLYEPTYYQVLFADRRQSKSRVRKAVASQLATSTDDVTAISTSVLEVALSVIESHKKDIGRRRKWRARR